MARPTPTPLLAILPTTVLLGGLAPQAGADTCDPTVMFPSSTVLSVVDPATGLPITFGTGVDTADLDGDGDLDAVSVDAGNSGARTVFLNNGDADPTIIALANPVRASSIDLADLDGDAIPDSVAALSLGGVEVRLGLGDGSFGVARDFALGTQTLDVRAVDMNGDDVPDLVAVDRQIAALGVLIGVGDGTFLPATTYATGSTPSYFAAVDLDLDGRIDVVVPNRGSGDVSVFINQGDGTLAPGASIAVAGTPVEVDAGDFNADGVPDLVVSVLEESSSVLLGLGDGTFELGDPLLVPFGAGRVTVLDLDGDARPDLACYPQFPSNGQAEIAWMFTGRSDGTFAPAGSYASHSGWEIVADDWTGDGIDDLLLIGHGLRVAPGDGAGALDAAHAVATGGAVALAADMNGDGIVDLVGVSPSVFTESRYVRVALGLGDGDFAPPTTLAVPQRIWHLAAGDLDGDGAIDLVGTAYSAEPATDDRAVVLLGNGDGTLTLGATYQTYDIPEELALADVDEDGHLDLLVAHSGVPFIALRRGNGDGTFQSNQPIALGLKGLVVEDFDGDGHLDLVAPQAGSFKCRLGNGDGTFLPVETFALPWDDFYTGYGLRAGDVNGDGVLDILGVGKVDPGSIGSIEIAVCLGNGDGSFAEATTFPVGLTADGARSLTLDDFDGDGAPDVAVAVSPGNVQPVSVLRGLGDGSFDAPEQFTNGEGPWALAAADFDANGAVDLAVGNVNDRNITIMLNRCAGTPACPADLDGDGQVAFADLLGVLAAWGSCDACAEDLDGSGDVDFADLLTLLSAWGPCA